MNRVVQAYANQELQVVLDNLNTHKPKRDWLNQAEDWYWMRTLLR